MAIVTAVEESRGKVFIDCDGRRLCAVKKTSFKKLPLSTGDAIDEVSYLERLASMQRDSCYEYALSLLDYSARASGEMRRKLLYKGYLEPAVDHVLDLLRKNRLINDEDYAKRLIETAKDKPIGVYQLKRKLRAKGVDENSAEIALNDINDESQLASAKLLAKKLLPKYSALSRMECKAKLSQAIARRGFSWDMVNSALESLNVMDDDEC